MKGLLLSHLPEHEFSVVRGTGEKFLLEGMPPDHSYLVLMLLIAFELFHHSDVEHFDARVSRSSEQPVPIHRVEPHLINCVVVWCEILDLPVTTTSPPGIP